MPPPSRKRRRLSDKDRRLIVVRTMIEGVTAVSRDLKIPSSTLYRWRDQFAPTEEELARAQRRQERRELARAEAQVEERIQTPTPEDLTLQVERLIARGWGARRVAKELETRWGVTADEADWAIAEARRALMKDAASRLAGDIEAIKEEHRQRFASIYEVAFALGTPGRRPNGEAREADVRFLRVALDAAKSLAKVDGVGEPTPASAVSIHVDLAQQYRENPEMQRQVDAVLRDAGYRLEDAG